MAKSAQLYRQNYCGCLYALSVQRSAQHKPPQELFSPLSGQILPGSIEERIALYQKRIELERDQIPYRIVKERFLNWRLLRGHIEINKKTLPAHFLPYSAIRGGHVRGKVQQRIGDLYFLNRNEIKLVTLETYNRLTCSVYKSIKELIFSPPGFEKELAARQKLVPHPYNLSTIAIVEKIPYETLDIFINQKNYEDVRETLLTEPFESGYPDKRNVK